MNAGYTAKGATISCFLPLVPYLPLIMYLAKAKQ